MSKQVVTKQETAIADRTPQVIAAEIRQIESQARQYVLVSAIEIGRRLHEAKALVPHGSWGKWLKENVNYSQSTANNFMRIADEYGGANLQAFANLSYTQAVALLSLPAEEREQFAAEHNVAEMSSRELQAAIKEKQELERKLKEQEEALKAEQERAEEERKKREALYDQYQAELNLRKEQEQKLTELQNQLLAAQNTGDDKAAAKIKTELRKAEKEASEAKARADELEQKMKQLESEIQARIEERVKAREVELQEQAKAREEAAAKQIAELEERLRKNNNVAAIEVKVKFETLVNSFQALITAVNNLENEEQKSAVKGRIASICDEMKAMLTN
jgi:DNA repair exonuclease SbcCD ATPase subunit